MSLIVEKYLDRFRSGRRLDPAEGEHLLDGMIGETDEPLLANLFRSWNEKGIDEDEIFAIANILRERCTRVTTRHETFVDLVGTGGSKAKTFNVSTAAAFVVAGAGVPVAKHGNRAATSNSGSADVLDELGIEPAVDAATAGRCLDEIGICFMFAPNFHRLSPTLAKVRRGLGFPTIFNCVGPLCNPASAPHQLIGVWSEEMVPKIAGALARLGTKNSWVVHGKEGLDEVSLAGPTLVAEVGGGTVREFEISRSDFGSPEQNLNQIKVASAKESAGIVREVLAANRTSQPDENIVLMNAAAAIHLSGRTGSLREAMGLAGHSLDNGKAMAKLAELQEATRK